MFPSARVGRPKFMQMNTTMVQRSRGGVQEGKHVLRDYRVWYIPLKIGRQPANYTHNWRALAQRARQSLPDPDPQWAVLHVTSTTCRQHKSSRIAI